jgi:hypothetical protein
MTPRTLAVSTSGMTLEEAALYKQDAVAEFLSGLTREGLDVVSATEVSMVARYLTYNGDNKSGHHQEDQGSIFTFLCMPSGRGRRS